ncbi:ABC transporter permease [Roseateles asaccharophilus]|uniref:Peptide/nickel transport system permease protein n=1 Tax=Roseateles asaccharophilus TaxID=582607 RepID=A0ABU2A404_9BURK|nr:ABC transporter permease [Roseateles asaccharophilus]MDR7331928.1 peptide/nickel transport system permease protein [Roseateles asaccharophilus]
MKFVLLWTDVALWLMAAAVVAYAVRVRSQAHLRATWERVLRDPVAASAGVVMAMFLLVTLVDSLHLRRVLPSTDGSVVYDTRTLSTLDLLLERQIDMREVSYSVPLGTHGFSKESATDAQGQVVREYPRLKFGGAHLSDPATQWGADVAGRVASGLAGAGIFIGLLMVLTAAALARHHGGWRQAQRDLLADRTHYPLRAMLLTLAVVALLVGPTLALMGHYHVLGTDRTGNDVLVQALKSVRTAFVIGALSTLATLPLALLLGVLAGYYKGWVDEVIQYVYTTLSSVPNVLLIAACVLMVQVFLDKNPELFETAVERSDLKMLMLCLILGLTGWAGLCRLVRAETLKLRELDYVQAATAFGVGDLRIMGRHILPNVMHLVLITVVLSFSELILYEAVLTYVGVGVDPTTSSFGGMINLARAEMSRDPVVWWSFAAAFGFMVSLVLAANLFADGVRDAFDPKARSTRPRIFSKKKAAEHA